MTWATKYAAALVALGSSPPSWRPVARDAYELGLAELLARGLARRERGRLRLTGAGERAFADVLRAWKGAA